MKYSILVKVEPDGKPVRLDGREAWMIRPLIEAGKRGVSPLDRPDGSRMSHYVYLLRRDGFGVSTEHEPHGGQFPGTHARYRLHIPVSILEDTKVAA
jgi:hypothetical protein